jgi:hypothetical protein
MKLIASSSAVVTAPHAHVHGGEESDGLEWEDLMPDINRQTDPSNMIWKLIDRKSGGVNLPPSRRLRWLKGPRGDSLSPLHLF